MCTLCGLVTSTGACQINCGGTLAQNLNTAVVASSPFVGGIGVWLATRLNKDKKTHSKIKTNEKK